IGTNTALETLAKTITANTSNGSIDINNGHVGTVTIPSMATGTGDILFNQSGGGALNLATAATGDGNIGIGVTGANLTAGIITAGGLNRKVMLTTTGSGNMLLGTITSALGETDVSSA